MQALSMYIPQLLAKYDAKKAAEKAHKKYVPEKNPQAGMMYGMLIVVIIFSVSWPAAMSIYWICSSIVMVIKTLLVRYISAKKKRK